MATKMNNDGYIKNMKIFIVVMILAQNCSYSLLRRYSQGVLKEKVGMVTSYTLARNCMRTCVVTVYLPILS